MLEKIDSVDKSIGWYLCILFYNHLSITVAGLQPN